MDPHPSLTQGGGKKILGWQRSLKRPLQPPMLRESGQPGRLGQGQIGRFRRLPVTFAILGKKRLAPARAKVPGMRRKGRCETGNADQWRNH